MSDGGSGLRMAQASLESPERWLSRGRRRSVYQGAMSRHHRKRKVPLNMREFLPEV
jgi:hypothetical protein